MCPTYYFSQKPKPYSKTVSVENGLGDSVLELNYVNF